MWHNQSLVKTNYCPSLDRLKEGDKVGIKYTNDRTLHLFVNGYDQGVAAYNVPDVRFKKYFLEKNCMKINIQI